MSRAGNVGTGFRDAVEVVDHHGNALARVGTDLSVLPYVFVDLMDANHISMESGSVGSDPTVSLHDGVIKRVSAMVEAGPADTSPTELFTIPEESFVLGVRARVITPFDGDTTQTITIGTAGDAELFIASADFDPSDPADTAAMSLGGTNNTESVFFFTEDELEVQAVWVNTDNETEGLVEVVAWYI